MFVYQIDRGHMIMRTNLLSLVHWLPFLIIGKISWGFNKQSLLATKQ